MKRNIYKAVLKVISETNKQTNKQTNKLFCMHIICSAVPMAVHGSYFGPGMGPVWLENVECNNEFATAFSDCPDLQYGVITDQECSTHTRDAGVWCKEGKKKNKSNFF